MMLLAIVLVPAIGALVALMAPRREVVLRIAVVAAASSVFLSLAGVWRSIAVDGAVIGLAPDLGPLGDAPLLVLDGLSAPWVVATGVLAVAVLAATPARNLRRANIIATLATAAATEGVLLSENVALTGLFWVLALVPGAILVVRHPDRAHARTYAVLAIGASAPMIGALVLLGRAGIEHGLAAPLDLDALATIRLPLAAQTLPLLSILAGVAVRMGLFPFHSWLPPLMQRGPVGVVAMLLGVHTGLFVVAKIALPLLPDASAIAMPYVADFALVACVWGALLALVQTDLARMLGFIAGSKAGMVLVGIASLEPSSLHGALLQSVGSGVALTGVLVVVRAIDARCGTRDVRHLGGLVAHAPRGAAAFFVLSAATVGFPGSLGFVGEDLLVHGVLDAHPLVATTLLLATALNGITMFRAFCRTFLGRPADRPRTVGPLPIDDFLPRERAVTAALIVLLVGFGLAPGPLLGARRSHVEAIAATMHLGEGHHGDGPSLDAGR